MAYYFLIICGLIYNLVISFQTSSQPDQEAFQSNFSKDIQISQTDSIFNNL
jgi:hypothetical protein